MMHDPLIAYLDAFARRHVRVTGGRPATAADLSPAQRLLAVKVRGAVPEACGPEIPDAPARLGYAAFQPMASYPKGDDEVQVLPAGYRGRDALRSVDAFDRMAAAYARQGKPLPFTDSQVHIARQYAAMVERDMAKGAPRSCLADSGRGSAGDYLQASLDASKRLAVLRKRIGTGVAKAVRRRRPSQRRAVITDRALVDAVCLGGKTVVEVLRAAGWMDCTGRPRRADIDDLVQALAGVLDRMMGPVGRCAPAHTRTDAANKFWRANDGG